jgi:hypothetical protein
MIVTVTVVQGLCSHVIQLIKKFTALRNQKIYHPVQGTHQMCPILVQFNLGHSFVPLFYGISFNIIAQSKSIPFSFRFS